MLEDGTTNFLDSIRCSTISGADELQRVEWKPEIQVTLRRKRRIRSNPYLFRSIGLMMDLRYSSRWPYVSRSRADFFGGLPCSNLTC